MDVRNGEKNVKLFVPLKFQISIQGGNEMNCRIEKMDSFKIIGFKKQFNGETSYQEIPKYWDEVTETHGKRMFILNCGKLLTLNGIVLMEFLEPLICLARFGFR